MSTKPSADRVKLLETLLVGLLDGVDGYEAETGSLHPFWQTEKVEAARSYLAALPDGGAAAGYWLANSSRVTR